MKIEKNKNKISVKGTLKYTDKKIYDIQIGGLVYTLQYAMNIKKVNVPWFLTNKNINSSDFITHKCHFYDEFASHVRNGYFHTDMINSLENGKGIYYKVAFWFVQCLNFFNPY